jgi:hypothetical protein
MTICQEVKTKKKERKEKKTIKHKKPSNLEKQVKV